MTSLAIDGPPPPDVDRHWIVDTVAWTGTSIATILVVIRIYTRARILHCADWLDVLVALAAIFGIVASSVNTAAGYYGAGRHVYYVVRDPRYNLTRASLLGTIGVPFTQMALSLPKIAAAAVLLRIAGPAAKLPIRIYFYVLTVSLVVLSVLYCTFIFVQCQPVFALWTDAPGAKCWPRDVVTIFGTAVSAFSAFIDLNLALYPIWIIGRLEKMPIKRKVGICILMGLGILATVCAGFKIPHLKDQQKPDVTFDIVDLVCWSLSEMNLILIAACVPFLKPLVVGFRDSVAERRKMAKDAWTLEHGTGSGGSGGAGAKRIHNEQYGRSGSKSDPLVEGSDEEDYVALNNRGSTPVSPVDRDGERMAGLPERREDPKDGGSGIELQEIV